MSSAVSARPERRGWVVITFASYLWGLGFSSQRGDNIMGVFFVIFLYRFIQMHLKLDRDHFKTRFKLPHSQNIVIWSAYCKEFKESSLNK
jgi:hypothetical protein